MANTILGVFSDPLAARRAVETLREGSLDLEDVSIVSRATETGAPVSSADDVSATEGATVGAVWGGLVGLASLLIPGIGPFIAFGALGAALTGAVTGAVVGGIAAALIDFGDISPEEASVYEEQVHQGMTLVAVKASDENAHEVRRILAEAGADSIRDNQTDITAGDAPVRVAMEDAAEEFGGPANPTTTARRGIYAMPEIDRSPDMTRPSLEPEPTTNNPTAVGSGEAIAARHSGSYEGDQNTANITTPETLGTPPSTGPDTNINEDDRRTRETM